MKKLESTPETLRLFLSSLVFRFNHVTDGAPEGFADFDAGQDIRTPARIVLHMTGMMQWVRQHLDGGEAERLEPLAWQDERDRFVASVTALDAAVAKGLETKGLETKGDIELWQLWQGPLTDAMTHIGQLAMLRRMAGSCVDKGVRYWQADMPVLND